MKTEKLRELVEAMTPGPWAAGVIGGQWQLDDIERCIARPTVHENAGPDTEGIAALRNHALAMIDVVEAAHCEVTDQVHLMCAAVGREVNGEPYEWCKTCEALARLEEVS